MAKKKVEAEVKFTNAFSALNANEKKKKKSAKEVETDDKKNAFAFANQPSTSAWGDESDEEGEAVTESVKESEEEESDSEEDSDEEEDEEVEEEAPKAVEKSVTSQPKVVSEPTRTLSKSEKKKLEMEALEAALQDLGINLETPPVETCKKASADSTVVESGDATSSSKKKKKGKKKATASTTQATESTSSASVDVVDIKSVLKSKSKGKKKTESTALKVAREEVLKAKDSKKKNRDKSTFNEFSY